MGQRYLASGMPDIGAFEQDVQLFLKTSLSLFQRAKRLKQLNEHWDRLGVSPEHENAAPGEEP